MWLWYDAMYLILWKGIWYNANGIQIILSRYSAIISYPMTYILSESEATITRGIWSHIPLPVDPIYPFRGSPEGVYGSHFECHWRYTQNLQKMELIGEHLVY